MSLLMASLLFTGLMPLTVCFADRDLLVCGAVHDGAEPAGGYLQVGVGRDGQWAGRRGRGLGTIAATYLTGMVADRYSFAPILSLPASCRWRR